MNTTMKNDLLRFVSHENVFQQLRIRYSQAILTLMLVLCAVFIGILLAARQDEGTASGLRFLLITTSVIIGLLLLLRRNRLVTPIMIGIALILTAATFPTYDDVQFAMVLVLALVSAAILLNGLIYTLVTGVLIIRLLVFAIVRLTGAGVVLSPNTLTSLILISVMPLAIALMVRFFTNALQETAVRARRTTELLEATASTGQAMAQLLDLNELLRRGIDLILHRFGFYHVQIFLTDDKGAYATLAASTGEIGQKLMSRGHRVAINSQTIIGRVIQSGEVVLARNTEIVGTVGDQDLLPRTRSELALPILDNETIIGALDVHSMRVNAFSAVEIQALQVMTGQLATAIRNARLFLGQEQSLRENKRLFLEAETSLREIQRLNRQLTRQSWGDYLTSNRTISGVTLDSNHFHPGAELTERMVEAATRRRVIAVNTPEGHIIAVPVELRGEVVGAIEIESSGDIHTEETIDLMQAIAGRLAISLDNARLFEETQEATAQEQRISEIVSQYQSAATVDDLLQITLQGLFETLGAEKASIRLGAPPEDEPNMPPGSSSHASNGSNGSNGKGVSA